MAELICILWASFLWLNLFLVAFIVFLDHENIGFVTLIFGRFGHVLAELCFKNEFCMMAELICILCKMLKGTKMASSGFLCRPLKDIKTAKKRCMDCKSRLSGIHVPQDYLYNFCISEIIYFISRYLLVYPCQCSKLTLC